MTTPAPTRLTDRIATLDVLRGVAICGILLMNIPGMGGPWDARLPALPARWDADWIAWGLQSVLAEGTMRGLFTMLFGAGLLLMTRRAEGPDGAAAPLDVWARRCVALMILGVAQAALFLWPGEILFNYGVTGLLLLAFRTARPRTLLLVAAAVLLAISAKSASDAYGQANVVRTAPAAEAAKKAGRTLTEPQEKALKALEGVRSYLHPKPATLAEERRERTAWPSVLFWSWEEWSKFNWNGFDWVNDTAESLGFMLIGMALFRTGVLTGQASGRTYGLLMLLGYGGGLGLRLYFLWHGSLTGYDLDPGRIEPAYSAFRDFSYEPARLLVTLGHLGLIASLFRAGALGQARPLRALGRMALTVYTLQSVLTSILFYAMGWLMMFGFAALMAIAAGIWVVTALFCLWWLRRHDMGPMEALLRRATYGSFDRRRAEADAVLATAPAL